MMHRAQVIHDTAGQGYCWVCTCLTRSIDSFAERAEADDAARWHEFVLAPDEVDEAQR